MNIKTFGYYRSERVYWTDNHMGIESSGWYRDMVCFNEDGEVLVTVKHKSDFLTLKDLDDPYYNRRKGKYKFFDDDIIEFIRIGVRARQNKIRIKIVDEDTIIYEGRELKHCLFD